MRTSSGRPGRGETLEPHRLAAYLHHLAVTFTSFYELCPTVISDYGGDEIRWYAARNRSSTSYRPAVNSSGSS